MEEDASAVSVGEAAVERYIKMVYKQQQRLTSADSRWIWVSCELCLPVYKEVMNGLRPHTTQGTIHKSNRRCSKNPEWWSSRDTGLHGGGTTIAFKCQKQTFKLEKSRRYLFRNRGKNPQQMLCSDPGRSLGITDRMDKLWSPDLRDVLWSSLQDDTREWIKRSGRGSS